MDIADRIETALQAELDRCATEACPPVLRDALLHAVFPPGARARARLCLGVALACGDRQPSAADAAAAAIELMHCASLVHDDLPCFDDAAMRRGKPSVHAAFGERIAVLAGDALIMLSFEALAQPSVGRCDGALDLIRILATAAGAARGITAGQAWECETKAVDTALYHRLKTGSLFTAAAMAGAVAAGADPELWKPVGDRIGAAYQLADDLRDLVSTPEEIGKPVGQDAALGRPNAGRETGITRTVAGIRSLIDEAQGAVPPCGGRDMLRSLIAEQARRVLPKSLAAVAA